MSLSSNEKKNERPNCFFSCDHTLFSPEEFHAVLSRAPAVMRTRRGLWDPDRHNISGGGAKFKSSKGANTFIVPGFDEGEVLGSFVESESPEESIVAKVRPGLQTERRENSNDIFFFPFSSRNDFITTNSSAAPPLMLLLEI